MEMLTKIDIPKMDAKIYAHNHREEIAALVFTGGIELCAEAALEGYEWALDAVGLGGCTSREVIELYGKATTMYHMGMVEGNISSVDIANAITELYKELKEANKNEEQNEASN